MALGCHPNIVGLGEIYAVFNKDNPDALFEKSTCSCGKKGFDCDFWKNMQSIASSGLSTEEKYRKLIVFFSEKYGEDMILLDSSKNSYPYLKLLNKEYDLQVIYLTRDYRSWVFSRFARTRKPMLFLALRWYFENKKLLYVLKKYGLKPFKVGYEELAMYPELTLRNICSFCNIDFTEDLLHPSKTKSHIINGNIARIDDEKKKAIFYDFRWMTSGRLARLSSIFAIFRRFNNRLVYSNLQRKNTDDFFIFGNNRKKEFLKNHNE